MIQLLKFQILIQKVEVRTENEVLWGEGKKVVLYLVTKLTSFFIHFLKFLLC